MILFWKSECLINYSSATNTMQVEGISHCGINIKWLIEFMRSKMRNKEKMGNFKLYGLIVGLTVTIMIVCDTLVYKVIDIYDLKVTASGIIFPLCYLLSTISTEVYGYKLGGRTVWIIVICQTVFVILIN